MKVVFPLLLASVVTGFFSACATRQDPKFSMPSMPVPLLVRPSEGPVNMPVVKAPKLMFPWLEINEFFPPRSRHIYPQSGYRAPHYVGTARAWFPSIEECTSPDGEWTLFHDGRHWTDTDIEYVIFVKRRGAEKARAIFRTKNTVEVLWSPNSSRAAVTVMTGSNRSVVVIVRMDDLKPTDAIWPVEVLRNHFSPVQIDAPQFMMALRWTDTSQLVIRTRGKESLSPFTIFGYELLVDTDHLNDPQSSRFLRGFLKTPEPDDTPKPAPPDNT